MSLTVFTPEGWMVSRVAGLDRVIGPAAERWTEPRWDEDLDKYVEGD